MFDCLIFGVQNGKIKLKLDTSQPSNKYWFYLYSRLGFFNKRKF